MPPDTLSWPLTQASTGDFRAGQLELAFLSGGECLKDIQGDLPGAVPSGAAESGIVQHLECVFLEFLSGLEFSLLSKQRRK